MRMRCIKPGICVNEDLAALGPYAYVLFTGLWMYADREGRFEWRPGKIKAAVMPLWDEVPISAVEKLLKSLWEKGFIRRYEIEGVMYGYIPNWPKHQKPHKNEQCSCIPGPSVRDYQDERQDASNNRADSDLQEDAPEKCKSTTLAVPSCPFNFNFIKNKRSGASNFEDVIHSDTAPPPLKTENTNTKTDHRPPLAATPRKPPATEAGLEGPRWFTPKSRDAPDFWPHQPETVAYVRDSLIELGRLTGMPPPDDGIVRRVLDCGRGANGQEIHHALRGLYQRQRFRSIRSWGLVPIVLQHCFTTAAQGVG